MGELSLVHWLIVGVIALLFFGPDRLPRLGKSLGRSIKEFKSALNGPSEPSTPDPVTPEISRSNLNTDAVVSATEKTTDKA